MSPETQTYNYRCRYTLSPEKHRNVAYYDIQYKCVCVLKQPQQARSVTSRSKILRIPCGIHSAVDLAEKHM